MQVRPILGRINHAAMYWPLLVKLLFVHFTADFLLQFDFLARGKERHGLASWHVWVHVALHGVVAHALLQTWWITLVTVLTHGIIDAAKISLPEKASGRLFFYVDQAFHLGVVAAIWWFGRYGEYPLLPSWFEAWLLPITGAMVLTKPGKYLIGVFLSHWTPSSARRDFAFCGPGPLVGMAERLVVLLLVLPGWWPVALLTTVLKIGAQQVGPFRSSDAEVRRFDLIGDLASFSLAWIVALLVLRFA